MAASDTIFEVQSGVLRTYEGAEVEVHGGAYLTPEAYLSTQGELSRLRDARARDEERSQLLPGLVVGAALVGLALGYWLGSGDDEG